MRLIKRLTTWGLILLAGIAIGFAFPAAATEKPVPPPFQLAPQAQKQDQSQSQSAEGGNAVANASSRSTSSADAHNEGNSLSQTYEDRLQAPSIFAPAVYASGPCAYGWSAGASGPGAGLSFGRSKADPSCDRRELARVLTPLNPRLALKILCADPIAREVATEADCSYTQPPQQSSTSVTVNVPPGVTVEHLNRAFEASQGK